MVSCVYVLQQLTGTLALAVFTAALGSLQIGYSLGVINAPQKVGQTSHPIFVFLTRLFQPSYYGSEYLNIFWTRQKWIHFLQVLCPGEGNYINSVSVSFCVEGH